jgi:hypothetical protein
MATLTNKRKVLSAEGKFKEIREMENGWGADVCWEFGLVNPTIQTICTSRSKLVVRLNGTDRE